MLKTAMVLAGMVAFVLLRYGNALENWWCCDDPQILLHALRYAPQAYFTEPAAWQALIPYSLTPWLSLAYDLDHALFGFQVSHYYLHNLLVIALCGWLLYLLARPWLGQPYALGVGLLFLAGAPIALASQQLMVRHYSEGMLFFLLAMLLSRQAVLRQHKLFALGAGIAFAIAASAKEIWLPLGLLVFLMPVANWQQRIRHNWPILLVMLLYIPWRYHMLGELLGGYTPASLLQGQTRLAPFIEAIQYTPAHFWQHPVLSSLLFGGLGLWALLRQPQASLRAAIWLSALAAGLLAPLYPLVTSPGLGLGSERYFIAIWAATALLAGLFAYRAQGRGIFTRTLVLTLFLILGIDAWNKSSSMLERQQQEHAAFRAQGQAIATLGPETVIVGDAGLPTWFSSGLRDLRKTMGNTGAPPHLIGDLVWLTELPQEPARYLAYQPEHQAMIDITATVDARRQAWHAGLRSIPMGIYFEHDRTAGVLRWKLSTGAVEGNHVLLTPLGHIPLPAQGEIRMINPDPGCFRIRFQAQAGWYAYGPAMALPLDNEHPVIDWQGHSELYQTATHSRCPQGKQ
jgi:hypothetical protein